MPEKSPVELEVVKRQEELQGAGSGGPEDVAKQVQMHSAASGCPSRRRRRNAAAQGHARTSHIFQHGIVAGDPRSPTLKPKS